MERQEDGGQWQTDKNNPRSRWHQIITILNSDSHTGYSQIITLYHSESLVVRLYHPDSVVVTLYYPDSCSQIISSRIW